VAALPEVEVRLPRAAPEDATAAATVVDTRRFAGEAKDVAALVATAPGVAVQEYGGLGQLSTVSLRGASADGVKILLDGLPLNSVAGGGVDLSTIPRGWVDRIEVVRGAEGARYGAGALGGAVNVITRAATPGTWSARVAGGSFLTGSAAADVGLGGERWGALVAASADGSEGRFPFLRDTTPSAPGGLVPERREHAAFASGGLLGKGWVLAGGGRIDGLLQLSGGERLIPAPPGDLQATGVQREGRAAATLRLARSLSPSVALSVRADGRAEALDLHLKALGAAVRQRDVAGALQAELTWTAGPSLLVAGLSAGDERLSASGFAGARSQPQLAAWLADELLLLSGRLRLAPALRAERIGSFDGLSARLGAAARIGGPFSLRAGAGRTFRAPSFGELALETAYSRPNPLLHPEKGRSADAALVAEGPWGLAGAGAFTAVYDDLIVYVPVSTRLASPRNVGRAGMRGLEAEAATAPLGPLGISAQLAYTWLAPEILRGTPQELGNDLPRRARHRLFARLGIAPGAWDVHAEAHLVGRQFQDTLNLAGNQVPRALTFHAGASVRVWRRPEAWVQLDVKNLADDRTLKNGYGLPLPGRMALLGLRVAPATHTGGGG
jgi:iron complex outermembrane receptor protein